MVSVVSPGHRWGEKAARTGSWTQEVDTALTFPLLFPIQQLPKYWEPSAAQHVWLWGRVPVPRQCPVPTVQLSAIKEKLSSPEVKAPQGSDTPGSRGEGRLGSPFPKPVSLSPHPLWLVGGMDSVLHIKGCTTAIGCRLMAAITSVGPMTVKETCSYHSLLQPRKAEESRASWRSTSLWVLELLLPAVLVALTHFP